MNMKHFTAFILCVFCTPGISHADVWTLDRTVSTAVTVSNLVDMEKLNTDSARLDAVSAAKGWYPTVSMSTGANVVSEVMEIKLPFNTIRFGDYDSYDFKLRFNQLIYDGGRLKALREASQERSEMSTFQADAVSLGVEFQAKAAFFGVVMAEKTIEASDQSINEAINHLRDVNARYREGMALENEVLSARLRISQTEMDLELRKADLEKARAAFRRVVGLGHVEEVSVVWNDKEPHTEITPQVDKVPDTRPEFRAFDAALAASEKSAQRARADIRPSIGLFGAFNYGKPGLDMPANEWMHYFSGGVLLNWSIWDWGTVSRNVLKEEINQKRTMKTRDDFKRNLTQQLSDAVTSYNAAKKREELAGEAAEYARCQLDLVTSSYREGMVTETDYDNAHTVYTRIILEKSVASVAVRLSEAAIEYVLGIHYSGGNNE